MIKSRNDVDENQNKDEIQCKDRNIVDEQPIEEPLLNEKDSIFKQDDNQYLQLLEKIGYQKNEFQSLFSEDIQNITKSQNQVQQHQNYSYDIEQLKSIYEQQIQQKDLQIINLNDELSNLQIKNSVLQKRVDSITISEMAQQQKINKDQDHQQKIDQYEILIDEKDQKIMSLKKQLQNQQNNCKNVCAKDKMYLQKQIETGTELQQQVEKQKQQIQNLNTQLAELKQKKTNFQKDTKLQTQNLELQNENQQLLDLVQKTQQQVADILKEKQDLLNQLMQKSNQKQQKDIKNNTKNDEILVKIQQFFDSQQRQPKSMKKCDEHENIIYQLYNYIQQQCQCVESQEKENLFTQIIKYYPKFQENQNFEKQQKQNILKQKNLIVENDTLNTQVFLLACENDRLRNEDQVIRNFHYETRMPLIDYSNQTCKSRVDNQQVKKIYKNGNKIFSSTNLNAEYIDENKLLSEKKPKKYIEIEQEVEQLTRIEQEKFKENQPIKAAQDQMRLFDSNFGECESQISQKLDRFSYCQAIGIFSLSSTFISSA